MPNIKAETEVSYPADFLYEFCEKPENLATVSDFIKSCQVIGTDGEADIVKMEYNVPKAVALLAYPLVGDVSSMTGKVTRDKANQIITVERIQGPFKKFTIRFDFNTVAEGKTKISMDVDFTCGGTGWADKKIMAEFNKHADSFLSDMDGKIKQAIDKGHLKLPPPKTDDPAGPSA